MSQRTEFVAYSPKTILNKSKRPDHRFWTHYSAYPYLGCQHGCEFCRPACRERKYYPYDDVNDYAYVVKVKQNAPVLLRRALGGVPVDRRERSPVITTMFKLASLLLASSA